jgi:hypothetical protein
VLVLRVCGHPLVTARVVLAAQNSSYYDARHRIDRNCNPANPVLLQVVDQAAMLRETFLRQTGPAVTVTEPVLRPGIESPENLTRWLVLSIGSLMYRNAGLGPL